MPAQGNEPYTGDTIREGALVIILGDLRDLNGRADQISSVLSNVNMRLFGPQPESPSNETPTPTPEGDIGAMRQEILALRNTLIEIEEKLGRTNEL